MWWRLLKITLLFVSTAFAQDRLVAVGSNVFRVSPDHVLTGVLQSDPTENDLRFGSNKPRISPDQQWIAYVSKNAAWVRRAGADKANRLEVGEDSDEQHLSIKVFLIGFTPDSAQLLYSIAPGKDECPDCRRPAPTPRKANYGFFFYTMSTHRTVKVPVPESTRVLDIVSRDRLFMTNVGAYGDVIGFMNLRSQGFETLPAKCASAASCSLASSGASICTQIGDDHSQIVECNVRSGSERPVSPLGDCINEFHRPSRSPAATHLAYLQTPERCSSRNRVLWIDQKPVFQCQKADEYGWIDESRLIVQCEHEFVAIDVTGKKLTAIPIRKSK